MNTIPGAQPVFAMPDDDEDKPPVMIMPRMFLAYDGKICFNVLKKW